MQKDPRGVPLHPAETGERASVSLARVAARNRGPLGPIPVCPRRHNDKCPQNLHRSQRRPSVVDRPRMGSGQEAPMG
jgi:hypothetical protein